MRNFVWTAARATTSAMVVAFVVSDGRAFAENSGTDGGRAREWRAIEWSLRLVALDQGIRVTLIDPDLAPDPDAIARLDAFIVRNAGGDLRPVIYINRRSTIVQRAAAGEARAIEELAAVIHHEARHLAGDSERDAICAERQFLQSIGRGDQTHYASR
jgi:hypothetical protein